MSFGGIMDNQNNRPWLKSYPEGVPSTVDTGLFNSLVDMFEFSCEKYGTKPALYGLGTSLTYAELDHKARCFAAYLQCELNVKPGDHIALMLPNIVQYPVALFGALLAGAVIVNVNPMYTPRELVHQLNDFKFCQHPAEITSRNSGDRTRDYYVAR